jgi:phenylacetate-CoA ligase
LQNAAISVAGLKWRFERYGGCFPRLLTSLKESEWLDEERISAYQQDRLGAMVRHAFETVPHYREVITAAGVAPEDIRTTEDLARLPILTKESLRQAGTRLRSIAPLGRLRTFRTSGTTGTPLTIWKTADADRFQWAVWWRHRARFGLTLGDRFLTFGARVPSLAASPRPPIWRTNHAIRQSYLPVSLLTPESVPQVVAWLDRQRFAFFAGYPSGMHVLAREMLEHGLRLATPPRMICCGSESLSPAVAATLRDAFQASVTQVYGMGESAGGFAECEMGRLHLDFELGIVELLPIEGQPAGSTLRRVVCTGLQNLAMPLIRYQVGDHVQVSTSACGCGRRSRIIDSVDGRLEDFVVTSDGRRVFGLNQVFKLARQIKESQVFQDSVEAIQVRIVPSAGYDRSDEPVLRAELQLRLGPAVGITFHLVDAIERTAGGKLRAVVSTVPGAQQRPEPS